MVSVLRLIAIALGVLAALSVLLVLAFSTVLADPTSGSGEGRSPGATTRNPVP